MLQERAWANPTPFARLSDDELLDLCATNHNTSDDLNGAVIAFSCRDIFSCGMHLWLHDELRYKIDLAKKDSHHQPT